LDPTVKDTIAFDIKSYCTENAVALEYWWNSTTNDGYAAIYFNGAIIFGSEVPSAIVNAKTNANGKLSAYFMGNSLYINKGKDNLVVDNIKVYNVSGQVVKIANNQSSVNMNDVVDGVYLVKVENGNVAETIKVVKR
jgi:hypothetical protein